MYEFPNFLSNKYYFFDNDDSSYGLYYNDQLQSLNILDIPYNNESEINYDNEKYNGNNNDKNNFNLNLNVDGTTLEKTKKKANKIENNANCWDINDIKNNIFNKDIYKSKFPSDLQDKLIENVQIDEPFLSKKRIREFNVTNDICDLKDNNYNNQINGKIIRKRGRKQKNDKSERDHNKMSPDNIIKKIKGRLFKYCTMFINNVLKEINAKEKIYDLDYKIIKQLKRDKELHYMQMPLKDLFSLDISSKFENKPTDTNKMNIQALLFNNEDDYLKFIFNMTFGDWIDIFTYKKNVSEILSKYNFYNNDGIDVKRIEENMIGVHVLLREIAKKNNDEYFSLFTFYIYNYELWFSSRRGRKREQKE